MPELPEVEVTRRNLERWLKGRKVVSAEADVSRVFRGTDRLEFEKLSGKLTKISRRGKYLLMSFAGDQGLIAHLGMTGKFVRRKQGQVEPYSRARLILDKGGVIHFRDPRLFGRMEAISARQMMEVPAVRKLGVDPLVDGLDGASLEEAVGSSKQDLKVALMDQERIAGLGNIHAAEALFRARLHPARKPATLKRAEWKRLAQQIHETIAFALDKEKGEEIEYVEEPGSENPFLVYGRKGERCRQCRKGEIQAMVQCGRTTYFCDRCQQ